MASLGEKAEGPAAGVGPPWPERYNSYSRLLRERFGEKVVKLAVDAGFTCPNRDGTRSRAGCLYCNNESFSAVLGLRGLSVREQLERGKARYRARGKPRRFLAYFQPYSNTYAPVNVLRELYEQALEDPDVVGIAIGTRPDCLPEEVLDLIGRCASRKYVVLEIGLQSASEETLARLNRGHTVEEFAAAVRRAAGRGAEIGTHVILGLPGEGREEVRATAHFLAGLPVDSVKLHHCYVCEGTQLAEDYRAGRFAPLEIEDYVSLACDFLERIPAQTAVQRVCGDCRAPLLIAPEFRGGVTEVARRITGELARRGTWQGVLVKAVTDSGCAFEKARSA